MNVRWVVIVVRMIFLSYFLPLFTYAAPAASTDARLERIASAIVSIRVDAMHYQPTATDQWRAQPTGSLLGDLMPQAFEPQQTIQHAGAGFIIDSDGWVITNAHVISQAKVVRVRTFNGREFSAEVAGIDSRTDLALLKIYANNLPVLQLGNSARLQMGEAVYSVLLQDGDQILAPHFARGTILSLPFHVFSDRQVQFIHTSVALLTNNAGSPLFNEAGEVVGIAAPAWEASFASSVIPIETAQRVISYLKQGRAMPQGWLGVLLQEQKQQVSIVEVDPFSPASIAGLQSGDVIQTYDDRPVRRANQLVEWIMQTPPNSWIWLNILRNNQDLRIQVKPLTRPGADELNAPIYQPLGIAVESLTEVERLTRRLPLDSGVLITVVIPGGKAHLAGIYPHDVLLAVDNIAIDAPEKLQQILEHKSKEAPSFVLKVMRNYRSLTVQTSESKKSP